MPEEEHCHKRFDDDNKTKNFVRIPVWLLSIICTTTALVLIGGGTWAWNANADIKSNKANAEYMNAKLIDWKNDVNARLIDWKNDANMAFEKFDKKLDKMNDKLDDIRHR